MTTHQFVVRRLCYGVFSDGDICTLMC